MKMNGRRIRRPRGSGNDWDYITKPLIAKKGWNRGREESEENRRHVCAAVCVCVIKINHLHRKAWESTFIMVVALTGCVCVEERQRSVGEIR